MTTDERTYGITERGLTFRHIRDRGYLSLCGWRVSPLRPSNSARHPMASL
jgi:hypothetical protein